MHTANTRPSFVDLKEILGRKKVPGIKNPTSKYRLEFETLLRDVFYYWLGWDRTICDAMHITRAYDGGYVRNICVTFGIGTYAVDELLQETFPGFDFEDDEREASGIKVCGDYCTFEGAAILALRKYDRGFRKWWKTKAGVKQLSDITKVASDLAAASVALNTYAKGL